MVFIASLPAYANEKVPYKKDIYEYQIYASGFKVLDAVLTIEYGTDVDYKISLSAKTHGWLGKLVPWSGDYQSSGWIMEDGLKRPMEHISSSIWRGTEAKKNFYYKQDGSFKKLYLEEKGRDYTPKNFDYNITDKTVDLLTANLMMMEKVGNSNSCKSNTLVFDGKRSFNLKFDDVDVVQLKSSKYNIYSGKAYKCTVEIEPQKGYWHEKPRGWLSIQEQGRNKGALPTIWLGKMEGDNLYVPVKIMVKTDYGALMMHLKKHQKIKQKDK